MEFVPFCGGGETTVILREMLAVKKDEAIIAHSEHLRVSPNVAVFHGRIVSSAGVC